jgi:hypothetical protein
VPSLAPRSTMNIRGLVAHGEEGFINPPTICPDNARAEGAAALTRKGSLRLDVV